MTLLSNLLLLAVLSAPLSARAAGVEALPNSLLFAPLVADTRWPALSGSMQRHFRKKSNLLWAANFGESLPLLGHREGGPWQFGVQAAVFTIWDMKTISNDMINADFLVGLPFSWRRGPWSGMARLYHISSHLGDEFILQHRDVGRMNLSYEALDLKLSRDLDGGFRLYGGAGYMYRRYPKQLKPIGLQAGAEWLGPPFAGRILRPLAAADLKKHQQNGWGSTNISLRAGVQAQNREKPTRRLQLLLEYYRGHDVNGQFFRSSVEHIGLGLHAYF